MTPQPLTPDLHEIDSAWRSGIASHRAGFALASNPYKGPPQFAERLHYLRLKAWAFDLGWRESEELMGSRRRRGAA